MCSSVPGADILRIKSLRHRYFLAYPYITGGFPPPLMTRSSAMNSAQEDSIYIGPKVMNSVQVGRNKWACTYRIANFSVGGPNIRSRSGHPGLAHTSLQPVLLHIQGRQ